MSRRDYLTGILSGIALMALSVVIWFHLPKPDYSKVEETKRSGTMTTRYWNNEAEMEKQKKRSSRGYVSMLIFVFGLAIVTGTLCGDKTKKKK